MIMLRFSNTTPFIYIWTATFRRNPNAKKYRSLGQCIDNIVLVGYHRNKYYVLNIRYILCFIYLFYFLTTKEFVFKITLVLTKRVFITKLKKKN